MVPSSSGLGRRPLTPVTRVRIPLGLPTMKASQSRGAIYLGCFRTSRLTSGITRVRQPKADKNLVGTTSEKSVTEPRRFSFMVV